MYNTILFDLDGTLTDSGEGVKKAFMYALEKFGIHESFDNLDKVMGPPLKSSFMDFYGFSENDALKAIDIYREYYTEKGVFENKLYDGIKETLSALKEKGKTLAVATSKPENFAFLVLTMFDILKYFDVVVAATSDGSLSKKSDIVKIALERTKGDMENAVMVGDRYHDILGAHENNIKCIGVLYGYGDYAEHEKYKADYKAKTPYEILDLV